MAPPQLIHLVCNRNGVLQGLQSDSEFAAVFARSKWRQSRWAPSRIRIVSVHCLCCNPSHDNPFAVALWHLEDMPSVPAGATSYLGMARLRSCYGTLHVLKVPECCAISEMRV